MTRHTFKRLDTRYSVIREAVWSCDACCDLKERLKIERIGIGADIIFQRYVIIAPGPKYNVIHTPLIYKLFIEYEL